MVTRFFAILTVHPWTFCTSPWTIRR